MKALALIPARKGSERLPGKNRRILGGRSLLARAVDACREASALAGVLLSTDDEVLLEEGAALGIDCIVRPPELCAPRSKALDYVTHAMAARPNLVENTDGLAIVQLTSPFTLADDIDGCLSLLDASGGSSAVSVMQVDHAVHPHKFKTRDSAGRLQALFAEEGEARAAHELPAVYVRNGSIYACRYETIHGGSLLGEESFGYLMPRERSLDINDAVDWALAEVLAQNEARPGVGQP